MELGEGLERHTSHVTLGRHCRSCGTFLQSPGVPETPLTPARGVLLCAGLPDPCLLPAWGQLTPAVTGIFFPFLVM